ncbi:hypothetical protein BCR34DRAFT_280405 [Clohesyomyces aquaticus]|uniref:Oxidoreductase ucpA n=1 Tax=Clohesyomyces aquaticus TaxID=1231657 RepID=A0A1Y1Y0R2_9PLEO|nr:hypothetical protein BCR34DRAFT_280405 [Clohesyomyces aquaticus]
MPSLPPITGFDFPGIDNLHNDIYPAIDARTNHSLSQPGKVVLITGAGRGIGRSIALQYAAASVSSIILCARTSSELDEVESSIKAIDTRVRVTKFQLDVTSEEAVSNCSNQVKAVEGRLDVLVNNAGATDPWLPIAQTNPKAWWKTLEVNLKGPYLLLHAFLPLLVDTAKANNTAVDVINVASIGAHVISYGASAYIASKIAVLRLTESVNAEYGDQGVNAISVHPGGVVTDLSKAAESEMLNTFLNDTPDLAGGFVVWLTAAARTWLAGRYVSATWDVERLDSMKDEIVEKDKLLERLVV